MKTSRLDDQTLDEILQEIFLTGKDVLGNKHVSLGYSGDKWEKMLKNAKKAILDLIESAKPEKKDVWESTIEMVGETGTLDGAVWAKGYNKALDDYSAALKRRLG